MRSNISFSVEVLWIFMGDIGSKIGLEDRPFVIKMCYGVRILRRISDSLRFLSGCKIYYSRETALKFKVKSRVLCTCSIRIPRLFLHDSFAYRDLLTFLLSQNLLQSIEK